jgi:hypothetical protein
MIKYKMMRKSFVVLALFFASFALVHAISVNDFYDVSVEFTPDTPGPNTSVSASVVSYSFDINRASINWILNGQSKLKGTGQKSFSFTTGNIGSKTNLSVVIVSSDGIQVKKDFSFQPAEVDILWEALNYTPVYYKGKALPASGSLIKVTAMPSFPGSSSGLVYEWQIDYKNKPDISGTGKNSFVFTSADVSGINKIGVTVSNYSKSVAAQKSIEIEIREPKLVFYEEGPLEGTKYNRALTGDLLLNQDQVIIKAEPYFFSKGDLKELSYEWLMNSKKVSPEGSPNVISLKKGEASGRSLVDLTISNTINILQYAENKLGINY